MVNTPFGCYAGIDRSNRRFAHEILAFDKHQIVEGRVAERYFDELLSECCGDNPLLTPHPIDAALVSAGCANGDEQQHAFVLPREMRPGLGRVFLCLEKLGSAYLVFEDSNHRLCADQVRNGKRQWMPMPLDELVTRIGKGSATYPKVNLEVRDANRQHVAIPELDALFPGSRLWDEVVRPRLVFNFALQPWFDSTWNLDKICTVNLSEESETWLLEVKHKYPFGGSSGLAFGLNVGEIETFKACLASGMQVLHLIIVKPKWTRQQGALDLFTAPKLQSRALVIALRVTQEVVAQLDARETQYSPEYTQLEGRGRLAYKRLDAIWFRELGVWSERDKVIENLRKLFAGKDVSPVTDRRLTELRIR